MPIDPHRIDIIHHRFILLFVHVCLNRQYFPVLPELEEMRNILEIEVKNRVNTIVKTKAATTTGIFSGLS